MAHAKTINRLTKEKFNLVHLHSMLLTHQPYFKQIDKLLNENIRATMQFSNAETADRIAEAIRYQDGKKYTLLAYCIMPSHAHLVVDINRELFQPKQNEVLQTASQQASESSEQPANIAQFIVKEILESIQKDSSLYAALNFLCNDKLLRYESFNHIVHDEKELNRIVLYILQNPVKADIVSNWREWRWSFISEEIKYAADTSYSERI